MGLSYENLLVRSDRLESRGSQLMTGKKEIRPSRQSSPRTPESLVLGRLRRGSLRYVHCHGDLVIARNARPNGDSDRALLAARPSATPHVSSHTLRTRGRWGIGPLREKRFHECETQARVSEDSAITILSARQEVASASSRKNLERKNVVHSALELKNIHHRGLALLHPHL